MKTVHLGIAVASLTIATAIGAQVRAQNQKAGGAWQKTRGDPGGMEAVGQRDDSYVLPF